MERAVCRVRPYQERAEKSREARYNWKVWPFRFGSFDSLRKEKNVNNLRMCADFLLD